MAKEIDNAYRINAIRFLFMYKQAKKFLTTYDFAYLFKNFDCYDIDHIIFKKERYKKIVIAMMDSYIKLREYLDEESLKNLTIMEGQL